MSEATKRPWRVEDLGDGETFSIYGPSHRDPVCVMLSGCLDGDAALIVKAVNNFDLMLGELKNIRRWNSGGVTLADMERVEALVAELEKVK